MFKPEYHVTLKEAESMVQDCILAGLVPMLRGSPALGKSATVHAVAKAHNLLVIDARFAGFDPTDINGFPMIDEAKGIARYYPLETFPLEDWTIPEGYSGWLLFMDEFNSAPPAVQAASYKLVLDRMVGQRKLHPAVHMVAAGNLDSDGAITHEMSTALISRVINFQIKESLKDWLDWAHPAGIHTLITSFLEFDTSSFYTFDSDEPNQPFASPRTWEFVHKMLEVWARNGSRISDKMPMLVGALGEGVAVKFKAFAALRGTLPTKAEVLADPSNSRLPQDLGPKYCMTGALADWADLSNADKILTYIKRLQPADFQVTAIRNLNSRKPEFKTHPLVSAWMLENMDAFLGV